MKERGTGQPAWNPLFLSEEEAVAITLLRAVERFHGDFSRVFKEYGITGAQYHVLRILRDAGVALTCQELMGRMITLVPDLTRLIDRVEQAGLVERSRTPEDRRLVFSHLTPRGSALVERLDEPVRLIHRDHFHRLTPSELTELHRLLLKACSAPADGAGAGRVPSSGEPLAPPSCLQESECGSVPMSGHGPTCDHDVSSREGTTHDEVHESADPGADRCSGSPGDLG